MRALGVALLSSIAVFALLVQLAILRYPGGTWFDPSAPGHDLFRNFLCDLTQPIALNGQYNPGVGLAKTAMIVLDMGLLCMWIAVPAICPPSPLGRWVRRLGVVSFFGIVAVPLTPSLRLGVIHAMAVMSGALPGIAAGVLANAMLAGSPHRWLFRLGAVTLVIAGIDAAIYAVHTLAGGAPPLALPLLQRIALILLLCWMAAMSVTLMRYARPR
jgi:hypothetical protein